MTYYFFKNIQKIFEKKEIIALDKNEITQQLFKAIDAITDEKMRTLPYDKTIVATIVSNKDANVGKYQVTTDNNITFYAYSDITQYKVKERVYVRIPENDYTKQKVITGRFIAESRNIEVQKIWATPDNNENLSKEITALKENFEEQLERSNQDLNAQLTKKLNQQQDLIEKLYREIQNLYGILKKNGLIDD